MKRMQQSENEEVGRNAADGEGGSGPSSRGTGSSAVFPDGERRGRETEEERNWWAKREEKDREARSRSRGRYD